MKKSFLFFAALAAILSLSSCKKDFTPTPESGQSETSHQPARITVSVQGAPVTKADIATRNNEDRLNTVEVYVFDAQTGSITNGMLESYKKAEDAEILGEQHNNAKVTFNATTGKKHIYVVAKNFWPSSAGLTKMPSHPAALRPACSWWVAAKTSLPREKTTSTSASADWSPA